MKRLISLAGILILGSSIPLLAQASTQAGSIGHTGDTPQTMGQPGYSGNTNQGANSGNQSSAQTNAENGTAKHKKHFKNKNAQNSIDKGAAQPELVQAPALSSVRCHRNRYASICAT